mgnify:CR=1 FL=1
MIRAAPALLLALLAACGDGVRISSTRSDNSDAKGVLKVVDTLQCPQTMGSLTRKGSATEQGTVCTYGGPRGAEVILHLVSLSGTDSTAALKTFEDRLSASLPQAVAGIRAQKRKARAAGSAFTQVARRESSMPVGLPVKSTCPPTPGTKLAVP